MPLTNDEFESLLKYFVPTNAPGVQERRKHSRLPTDATATILRLEDGAPPSLAVVRLVDISRRGVRFVDARQLGRDDQFLLCLVSEKLVVTRAVLCSVRRCEPLSQGRYQIGSEFMERGEHLLPTETVMQGLMAFHAQAQTNERGQSLTRAH